MLAIWEGMSNTTNRGEWRLATYNDRVQGWDTVTGKWFKTEAQARFAARQMRLGEEAIDWRAYN